MLSVDKFTMQIMEAADLQQFLHFQFIIICA